MGKSQSLSIDGGDAGVQLLHRACGAAGGRDTPCPAISWLREGVTINSSAGGCADLGNSLLCKL